MNDPQNPHITTSSDRNLQGTLAVYIFHIKQALDKNWNTEEMTGTQNFLPSVK